MTRILWAVAVTTVCWIWPGAATADITLAQKCEARQLKAAGKDAACRAGQLVKGLLGGTADLTKCSTTFDTAFMNAEAKGGCPTTFTAAQVDSRLSNDIGIILSDLTLNQRFVDNGDGTITDNQTGLQWEKKVEGNGCTHCWADPYTWSNGETDTAPDGTAFTVFLPQLNACVSASGTTITGGFAGHCDWRLPTVAEMQSIVVCAPAPACSLPACDPTLVNFFPNAPLVHYWSSTTVSQAPVEAWAVVFAQCGSETAVDAKGKVDSLAVRAVRGP